MGRSVWRTHLKRVGIDQRTLTDKDAQVLSLTIYRAPEVSGHPAELDDGARRIDSVILVAVIQRHFLPIPEPAWDDVASPVSSESSAMTSLAHNASSTTSWC